MTVRACSRCGAPLDLEPGQTIIRCSFCGAENELPQRNPFAPNQPLVPHRPAPPLRTGDNLQQRIGAYVGAGIGVFTILLIVPLVLSVSRTPKTTASKPPTIATTPAIPIPTTPAEKHLTLAEIHDIQPSFMDTTKVDAPGRIGSASAFDPILNWDWMLSIAHAWWDDAVPYALSADPVVTDGTADITGDSPSTYMTFLSKKCRAALAERAKTDTTSHDSSCTLRIMPHADWVAVEIESIAADFNPSSAARPITKPPCTFGQAFTALSKRLTPRPRYAVRYENDFVGNPFRISNGRDTASMNDVSIAPSFCKSK